MGSLNEERTGGHLGIQAGPDVQAAPDVQPALDIQAIRETAASAAHGLNNLLGAVVGLSSQLLDLAGPGDPTAPRQAPAAAREHLPLDELRLIRQAALDGLALSRRLLLLSRGEPMVPPGGAPSLDLAGLELVDLGRTLLDAVELTRAWWGEPVSRSAAIVPVVEAAQPLLVHGVPADLREIVVNLIHNAVDAMPNGGHLWLRGVLLGESVIVTCRDSGVGMHPDVLARVFEPFFTTKGQAGTGLGLAIVRSVVGRHGGDARVTSQVGIGTTVTLRLPAAEPGVGALVLPAGAGVHGGARAVEAAATKGMQARSGMHRANGHAATADPHAAAANRLAYPERGTRHGVSGRRDAAVRAATAADLAATLATLAVLVVEDDPVFRAVFTRRLGLDARRVEAVDDAGAALVLLKAGRWDVLCVDDGLPDRPGRELAAEVRRLRLPCAFVLVTGTATGPDDPNLAGPGVDAILPKPCTDAELARALRLACTRQAERSSAPD